MAKKRAKKKKAVKKTSSRRKTTKRKTPRKKTTKRKTTQRKKTTRRKAQPKKRQKSRKRTKRKTSAPKYNTKKPLVAPTKPKKKKGLIKRIYNFLFGRSTKEKDIEEQKLTIREKAVKDPKTYKPATKVREFPEKIMPEETTLNQIKYRIRLVKESIKEKDIEGIQENYNKLLMKYEMLRADHKKDIYPEIQKIENKLKREYFDLVMDNVHNAVAHRDLFSAVNYYEKSKRR